MFWKIISSTHIKFFSVKLHIILNFFQFMRMLISVILKRSLNYLAEKKKKKDLIREE